MLSIDTHSKACSLFCTSSTLPPPPLEKLYFFIKYFILAYSIDGYRQMSRYKTAQYRSHTYYQHDKFQVWKSQSVKSPQLLHKSQYILDTHSPLTAGDSVLTSWTPGMYVGQAGVSVLSFTKYRKQRLVNDHIWQNITSHQYQEIILLFYKLSLADIMYFVIIE